MDIINHSSSAALWISGFVFMFYKEWLAVPASWVLPAHTRDAAFQLFCDLRTNNPKDKKFRQRHLRALTPRTFPGWVAAGAFLGYLTSMTLATLAAVLSLSIAAMYSALFVAGATVFFLTFVVMTTSIGLVIAACSVGMIASAGVWAYFWISAAKLVLSFVAPLVLGPSEPSTANSTAQSIAPRQETPASPRHHGGAHHHGAKKHALAAEPESPPLSSAGAASPELHSAEQRSPEPVDTPRSFPEKRSEPEPETSPSAEAQAPQPPRLDSPLRADAPSFAQVTASKESSPQAAFPLKEQPRNPLEAGDPNAARPKTLIQAKKQGAAT